MIRLKHKGNQKFLGRYRANDLLIAFDSLHLGGDGGRGHLPHIFLVQNLQDTREYPNVIEKEKKNNKKKPKKNRQRALEPSHRVRAGAQEEELELCH